MSQNLYLGPRFHKDIDVQKIKVKKTFKES